MAEKQQIRFEPDATPPPSVARVAGLGRVPDPIDAQITQDSMTPLFPAIPQLESGAVAAGDASKNLAEGVVMPPMLSAGIDTFSKARRIMQNYTDKRDLHKASQGRLPDATISDLQDPEDPKTLEDLGEGIGQQTVGVSGKQLGTKLGQGDIGGAIGDVVPSVAAALLMHKVGAKIKAGMPAPEPELHPASQQISELHAQHGGSTVNLNTGDQIGKHGYAVSLFPERTATLDHPPAPEEVNAFINANQDILQHPNASVGTWHDTSTGTHQLDVVGTTRSRANAIGHAERYNQKAIFDLQKLQEIPTGGTGEMTDSVSQLAPPVEQRLDSLAAGEPERAPFIGRHFSDAAIKNGILSGARRGSSGIGQEKNRLALGNGAEPGVYVYRAGAPGEPMITSRPHEYEVRGNKALANIEENPLWGQSFETARQQAMSAGVPEGEAFGIALNEAERAMKEEGYDGYFHPAYRNIVFMFGDQDAVPVGEKLAKTRPGERGSFSGAPVTKPVRGSMTNPADVAAQPVAAPAPQIVPGNADTNVDALKTKYGIKDEPRQMVGGQDLDVLHYSKTPGLNSIEPHSEGNRGWFFQDHPNFQHEMEGQTRYRGKISNVYDMEENPLGLSKTMRPSDATEAKIRAAGYGGVKNLDGTVISFGAVPVAEDIIPSQLRSRLSSEALAQLKTPESQRKFVENYTNLSSLKDQIAAAAKAGAGSQHWYERWGAAADALRSAGKEIFTDPNDQSVLARLTSALSANNDPTQEMSGALDLFKKWVEAGRPTDERSVNRIVYGRGERPIPRTDSAPRAIPMWESRGPNAVRALTGQDPLSGMKVDAYAANKSGNLDRGTLDRWGAVLAGMRQNEFSKPHVYHAVAQVFSDAGRDLGMKTANVQAGAWGFIRTLDALTGGDGSLADAQAALKGIKPEDISARTEDLFDILRTHTDIRAKLSKWGVKLSDLDEALKQAEARVPRQTRSGEIDGPQLGPFAARIAASRAGIIGKVAKNAAESRAQAVAFAPDLPPSSYMPPELARAISSLKRPK